ncbi:MAG: hypothetical protein GXP47_13575, partial [Acidobacteria bacterium]|nr:hypothetical protein [Acidobacteriota bacterium]
MEAAAPVLLDTRRPAPAFHGVERPERRRPIPPGLEGQVRRAADLVRETRRAGSEPPLPTGLPALDRLLGGGLPRGGIVELTAPRAAGRMGVVLAALATVTGRGEPAVLVDLGGHLDPLSAGDAGVDLPRLLWLRPRRLPEAVELAETFLQTEIPLVVLELGLPPVRGRVATAAWMRLRRAAATHGNALLIASPWHLSGHTAETVLRLEGGRPRWNRRHGAAPLLEGVRLVFRIVRQRGTAPGTTARQELRVAGAFLQPATARTTPVPVLH